MNFDNLKIVQYTSKQIYANESNRWDAIVKLENVKLDNMSIEQLIDLLAEFRASAYYYFSEKNDYENYNIEQAKFEFLKGVLLRRIGDLKHA